MHSNKIEAYKHSLKLSKEQRQILVGLLLGDATLETQNGGKTYRLKVEYSSKNKDYCYHVYSLFKEWVLTPPREKIVVSGEHKSTNLAFSTLSHGSFRFYAKQFYKSGKKVVPSLIRKLLTPRGIAYWFMDDGSIKSRMSKAVIFNTQGYTRADVNQLIEVLKVKFQLNARERKQKEGYQIYVSGHSYERFLDLVNNWIYPSMSYKIPQARRTHLPKM